MSSFLSNNDKLALKDAYECILTSVYDALPFVFILRPGLAIVTPSSHSYTHIDEGKYVLVI